MAIYSKTPHPGGSRGKQPRRVRLPGGQRPLWQLILIPVAAALMVAVPAAILTGVGTSLYNTLAGHSPASGPGGQGTSALPGAGDSPRAASTTAPPVNPRYTAQTGPGCPARSDVATSPYDPLPAHPWLRGGAPGCLSAYMYTQTTTSADPTQWVNDLDWLFSNVPTATTCTVGIYIPPVSRAAGTAQYYVADSSASGSPDYSSSAEITVSQAASRGLWMTYGPFRFPTGRAIVEITDAQLTGSGTTLVASAVRLLC